MALAAPYRSLVFTVLAMGHASVGYCTLFVDEAPSGNQNQFIDRNSSVLVLRRGDVRLLFQFEISSKSGLAFGFRVSSIDQQPADCERIGSAPAGCTIYSRSCFTRGGSCSCPLQHIPSWSGCCFREKRIQVATTFRNYAFDKTCSRHYSPRAMKQTLSFVMLIGVGLFLLSCGGGSMGQSLSVQPASATAFTNFATGFYQGVTLTATLSNGAVPASVTWKTSAPCVAIDPAITKNTTTVICNFTCGGTATATITATAQGLTGKSSVTCTWTT